MPQLFIFTSMEIKEFFEQGSEHYLPDLSVDLVVIGYQDNSLKCLLLKLGKKWLLPGGFIKMNESVDDAAARVLMERTHLEDPHLKFLAVFGAADRNFGNEFNDFFEEKHISQDKHSWFNRRFVTLAFYSLVDIKITFPRVGNFDEDFCWFDFDALPEMWMDHKSIVTEARNRLKNDIKQEQITYNLLPKDFTMPELHQLHELILEEKIDRSRFQKKMLASGRFLRLPMIQKETPGRNPYQYRIKDEG